jgi:hypothetical protein
MIEVSGWMISSGSGVLIEVRVAAGLIQRLIQIAFDDCDFSTLRIGMMAAKSSTRSPKRFMAN